MRCGDRRAGRERNGKGREDGREKREEKSARQQTLDSRACWMQTLKTFEEIWKSLTGLSRTLLWFQFPAHDNHTLRAHQKRANTFIHRVFIWVSVRIFFGNFREWRRHFVYNGDRDAENQGYRRWGDDDAHYLLPFPFFRNTWFGFCVWVFFCVFLFADSQLCIFVMSLLLLLLFLFLFPTCRGRDEKRWLRWREREDTKSWSWMQMAKTQKNKATAHHLGLLKVISYLDTLWQSISGVCGARMLIMMIQLGFFFFLSLYQRHNACDFLAGRCSGFFFCLLRCSFVHVSH